MPMTRQEALVALRQAFGDIQDLQKASDRFALLCYEVHRQRLLSDKEIAQAIGNRYSRSNIQHLRKKIEQQKESQVG